MKNVAPKYETPKLTAVGTIMLPGDPAQIRQRVLALPPVREKALDWRIEAHRRRRKLGRRRGQLTWAIIRRWRLQRLAVVARAATAVVFMFAMIGCGSVTAAGGDADARTETTARDGGGDQEVAGHDGAVDGAALPGVDGSGREAAADAATSLPDAGQACSWQCVSACYCGALPCCRSTTSADCCSQ